MKGLEVQEDFDTQIDLNVTSYIPEEYISDSAQKIEMYQNIALCKNEEDIQNVIDEMIDRFGNMPDEIEKLIDTADTVRNKAIIALMYSSGLRVSEVCKLAPDDIYMSTMQVHVRHSKNHGDHWTILSERALEYLKEYWYSRPEPRETFFVTVRKPYRPITAEGIYMMVRRVGEDAGIPVHPHVLRHSFATHLIENDTNREYVQSMLGHRSPSSTSVYVNVSNMSIMGVTSPLDKPIKGKKKSSGKGKSSGKKSRGKKDE